MEVVAGLAGGPWSVVVGSKIVYRQPTSGEWWYRLTVSSSSGRRVTVLVDPDHQAPAFVAAAVRAALEDRGR